MDSHDQEILNRLQRAGTSYGEAHLNKVLEFYKHLEGQTISASALYSIALRTFILNKNHLYPLSKLLQDTNLCTSSWIHTLKIQPLTAKSLYQIELPEEVYTFAYIDEDKASLSKRHPQELLKKYPDYLEYSARQTVKEKYLDTYQGEALALPKGIRLKAKLDKRRDEYLRLILKQAQIELLRQQLVNKLGDRNRIPASEINLEDNLHLLGYYNFGRRNMDTFHSYFKFKFNWEEKFNYKEDLKNVNKTLREAPHTKIGQALRYGVEASEARDLFTYLSQTEGEVVVQQLRQASQNYLDSCKELQRFLDKYSLPRVKSLIRVMLNQLVMNL